MNRRRQALVISMIILLFCTVGFITYGRYFHKDRKNINGDNANIKELSLNDDLAQKLDGYIKYFQFQVQNKKPIIHSNNLDFSIIEKAIIISLAGKELKDCEFIEEFKTLKDWDNICQHFVYKESNFENAFENLLGKSFNYKIYKMYRIGLEENNSDIYLLEHPNLRESYYLYGNAYEVPIVPDKHYKRLYRVVELETKTIELFYYEGIFTFDYGYENEIYYLIDNPDVYFDAIPSDFYNLPKFPQNINLSEYERFFNKVKYTYIYENGEYHFHSAELTN